ncbi:hypothetical protein SLOPH_2159 [Spraguea lophii 42_110]|uniref:Uncharacterized protein n=1 Tax=Spraguea lophii (strain 42_110) TaxID=1358809 RepID=S7XSA6_SPRLO|nr:hypothetical protein SLOPH_2159 [Spraguea lophii 42_110]
MDYDISISKIISATGCDYATAEYAYTKYNNIDDAIAYINQSNLYVGNGQVVQKRVVIIEYNNGIMINDKFYKDKEKILRGINKGEIDKNIVKADGDYVDVEMKKVNEDYNGRCDSNYNNNTNKNDTINDNTTTNDIDIDKKMYVIGESQCDLSIADNLVMDDNGIIINISINKKRIKFRVRGYRTMMEVKEYLEKIVQKQIEIKSIMKRMDMDAIVDNYKGGLLIVSFN